MINQWMSQRLIDHEFYSVIVDDSAMTPEERALYFYSLGMIVRMNNMKHFFYNYGRIFVVMK